MHSEDRKVVGCRLVCLSGEGRWFRSWSRQPLGSGSSVSLSDWQEQVLSCQADRTSPGKEKKLRNARNRKGSECNYEQCVDQYYEQCVDQSRFFGRVLCCRNLFRGLNFKSLYVFRINFFE